LKEETKIKDKVFLSRSTAFEKVDIPSKDVSSKSFDIRIYRNLGVMVWIDKDLWLKFKEACLKNGYDPRKVLYGSMVKYEEMFEEEKK